MLKKTVVLNVVGLTPALLGPHTPRITSWADRGQVTSITPVLPAVTCTAQATYLTGKHPDEHGIVANGWYFRDECEVKFWRQSNKLIQADKIWDVARALDPDFTCANLFWWYNMYANADYCVTPRPMYPADGRKLPDIYTHPASLRDSLQTELGQFPLFKFWGPATTIECSEWIANCAKSIEQRHNPTLTLVYLPQLDYCTQKVGSDPDTISQDLGEIDRVVGDLIEFYEQRGAQVILLSEYGITPVDQPVHLNRVLREAGYLRVREELGLEILDAGASQAFAVSDHQLAHIYINDPSITDRVKALLEQTPGVDRVLDEAGKREFHLDHARSGELVAIADPKSWFTYYYWLDDQKAPDFARTVDIHRKPGYDPVELFVDPNIKSPKLKIALTLLKRKLGGRSLMDLTPLTASLVQGSHGHIPASDADRPVLITRQGSQGSGLDHPKIAAIDVFDVILRHLKL
jgi:predicted AlkP superfamily pyrophosphatase or phosphodiesterase